jgi:phenylacetate-CoA ligase
MNFSRGLSLRLKDALLRCHYFSASHLKDVELDRTLERLERYGIRHLWGFPGSIYLLARRALRAGWNTVLDSVVTWGDNLYPGYRHTVEAAFGCRILDTYGCSEGMQIAAQCERRDLYHIHMLDVIVEFLDAEGKPAPPEKPGSIVVTRLHPGPMPFVRYRIGDVGIRGVCQCDCHRGFETMKRIEGRDTDYIVTPDGNRLIVHFFTGILEHFPEIESFQVIQSEPASITLRVVPADDFNSTVAERIIAALRQRGAGDLDIRLDTVQSVPLTAGGKRRFIVNQVGVEPAVIH